MAFPAASRDQIHAFHAAALAAGGRDNGPAGLRPQYHDGYYGAFVLDPAGTNAEAVYHGDVDWLRDVPPRSLDHVSIRVSDVDASARFYETVLEPLGFGRIRSATTVGFAGEGCALWVHEGEPTRNLHLAFRAADRATVDGFHRVALAAGYRDNGAPGERPQYHPGYYGAYVLDPEGLNVEAVFHDRS